jgi:hypothetical protein
MTAQKDTDSPFSGLIEVVSSDVMDGARTASERKTAQSFRTAIRAVFAGSEAIIWYAKALTLRVAERAPTIYSPFEMAALRDETYTVTTSGKVVTRANFVPLSTSIKLIVALLSRSQVSNANFELGQASISALEESLKVRHRLSHPKSAADMDVTEEDFQGSMMSWATVLTVGLNVALEADKRLGTGMFPWKGTNDTQAAGQGMNTDRANLDK